MISQRVNARTKRHSSRKDDHSDYQTDKRIEVELVLPVRLPDDQASGDNTDIAQRISDDVEKDSLHVHALCFLWGDLSFNSRLSMKKWCRVIHISTD